MNNCGYCKHYLPGKALCGLTKKEVGFLEVKPCYEANTNMEENNETKTNELRRRGLTGYLKQVVEISV